MKEREIPKISICIPTYNRSDLLRKTLVSVIKQTVEPYEVIVVDNCSEDDTEEVVKEFRNFKYYRNSSNVGMIENWNRCLELATGDFLTVLHSDDLISPFWVQEWTEMIRRHDDKNLGVYLSAIFTIDAKGHPKIIYRIFDRETILPPRQPFLRLWENNMCALPTSGAIIFRKSIFAEIGMFDDHAKTEADTLLALKILNRYGIFYTPKLLFAYRVHPFQSFDKEKSLKSLETKYEILVNHLTIFKDFYHQELRGDNKTPLFYKRVALMYIAIAFFHLLTFRYRKAQKYYCLTRDIFPDILTHISDFFLLAFIIKHYIIKLIRGRVEAFILRNLTQQWSGLRS